MSKQDEWRALADVLDRTADKGRNAVRVPLLHEAAAALRDAADRLDAVQAAVEDIHRCPIIAAQSGEPPEVTLNGSELTRRTNAAKAALTTPTDQEASK